MKAQNTIAAISTAQAAGGIGVIRISGEQAKKIAEKVFTSAHGKKISTQKGYTALYGTVHKPHAPTQIIDQAIALIFTGPASFTGEDVVELSCHGGLTIMKHVLRAVLEAGATAAAPGEFSKRAFLNGKLGLTEAEAIMELIHAQGEQAAKIALAGHNVALEKRIGKIREQLIEGAAHLSAWADYPEEDIPQIEPKKLKKRITEAKEEIEKLLSQFEAGKAIREGINTVIAGRPNAGKSTLMNLLSGYERSIVTQIAGTTRDIVEETVLLGDILLRIADTAGLRETSDAVEKIGVEKAKERIKTAELVLAVFDSSQKLSAEDKALIQEVAGTQCIAIINKIDLKTQADIESIQKAFRHTISCSAISGEGIKQLEQAVTELYGTSKLEPNQGILYTERQREAAKRAKQSLTEAIAGIDQGMTLDAVTVSIEGAISSLLELTGERATEAIVESVFSQFCVGK